MTNKVIITEHQFQQLVTTFNSRDHLLLERSMKGRSREVIDAIKNNSVVQIIYDYSHRDEPYKFAKMVRPFVVGISNSGKPMMRVYEYDSFRLPTDKLEKDGYKLRYTTKDREDLRGKTFKTYTTTKTKKWKTLLLSQITFWDELGQDDIDIPPEFKPSYKLNDKLFSNIQYQKR